MKKMLGFLVLIFCLLLSGSGFAVKRTVKRPVKVAVKKIDPLVLISQETQARLSLEAEFLQYKKDASKQVASLKKRATNLENDNDDIKVSSTLFFRWQKNGDNPNNFDVDRAYINFQKDLRSDAYAKLTLDAARLSSTTNPGNQNLYDFLKYAYVQVPLKTPKWLTASIKAGLQENIWIGWNEDVMGIRFIAKSFVDDEGLMPSSDFGVGLLGKISIARLPKIEYYGNITNGDGYSQPASTSGKDIAIRLNSTVYEDKKSGKVMLGAYGNMTNVAASGTQTKQAGFLLGLKGKTGTAYVEYEYGTGNVGTSIGALFYIFPEISLFVRKDYFNPARGTSNQQIDKVFYGAIYDWTKDIKIALDAQDVKGGSAASISPGKTTNIISLHLQANI